VARRLDAAFQAIGARIGAPGLVAAVRLPDDTVWYGAMGVLRPGGSPVTPDTPFAWGSITKTMTAALVLRLVDEGRIGLDDRLAAWFPDVPAADRITIRMLLAHTSGLFDYFQHPDYARRVFDDPRHAWTPDEILGLDGPAVNEPGEAFDYSNTNYVLLGRIVEEVTGEALADLFDRELLAPLGLEDTVFQQVGRPVDLVGADGFWADGSGGFREWSDGTAFRPTTSAASVAWAAAATMGSARDLLDWEMALYGGEVLAPDMLALMLDLDPGSGYGLGASRLSIDRQPGFGHHGSVRGFEAVMARLPDSDVDVVVLANLGFSDVGRVASRLVRAATGPRPTPVPLDSSKPTG
jgi:D-alanyl-D-alanine carboxypeptidase